MKGEPGRATVLIVDDDPLIRRSLATFLGEEGHRAIQAGSVEEARARLEEAAAATGVVLCDVGLPDGSGLDLLEMLGREHPATAAVMITGYGSVQTAVRALRLGACDYLTKPIVDEELRVALERALQQHALRAENHELKRRLVSREGLEGIIGRDPRMERVFEVARAVAASRTTVLMTGESGTGKSMVARAIHHQSPRAGGPFVELACGSIPETLLESELFGHAKGAFTGAHTDKAGRFLAAEGGTIFLDEINSASPAMQLKLLRVLQERRFEPVGSTETVEVDVRVVLAANEPLDRLVEEGSFRQDLFYRINVVEIELPPLRDRVGDIEVLAEHFLRVQAAELGKQVTGFTGEALEALRRYGYPGNVRELANIVERAAVLCRGATIEAEDLPEHVLDPEGPGRARGRGSGGEEQPEDEDWAPMPLEEALREPERRIILRTLEACEWNRQRTAEALGINRTTLYKKMKALGIDPEERRLAG